jgi:hypothetical protein
LLASKAKVTAALSKLKEEVGEDFDDDSVLSDQIRQRISEADKKERERKKQEKKQEEKKKREQSKKVKEEEAKNNKNEDPEETEEDDHEELSRYDTMSRYVLYSIIEQQQE